MSIVYLVDTNILSEPTRATPDANVMRQLQRHRSSIATASVVWHELWFGCGRLPVSRKRTQLETHFQDLLRSGLMILPYTQAAAEWHSVERARLTAIGQSPAFADGMIAATAHHHGLVLVTRNVDDFNGFMGIRLENWFEVA
ncbi:type II toxin-antitoxin system VapC family toxin [Thiothrix subterranea]|uniref:type II toxin-antitoxin system VapC family toxin n=1 Tax=Thiothrix subterranea TaxID=2735563 RepID=UPI00192C1E58|nr:type II toxin-antitoxin system VapC family toxin [Thiothrix subterranea]QQZ28068.1 type II toxin-antitoxin system VapC family toxin [Thiothrix subterranea]